MDNGTYFHGAANQLPQLVKNTKTEQSQEIVSTLGNDGTQFHFIPPHSPHFGGLWEAGVKSTKHHLNRVLGNTRLRYPDFVTFLAQVESMLNSRPLCPLSSDPNDLRVLTPGHFLIGRPLCMVPNPDLQHIPIITSHVYAHWQHSYATATHTHRHDAAQRYVTRIGALAAQLYSRHTYTHTRGCTARRHTYTRTGSTVIQSAY